MRFRGVSLDAAGTIIRIKHPVARSYADIANRHGIPIDEESIAKAFRTVFPRMSPLAFGHSSAANLDRQERDWWKTVVRNCLGRFGQHRAFNGFFAELYQYYADIDAWCVYEDVLPCLDQLDELKVPVIVVSNFDSRLHALLKDFALHDRFRSVLCSSEAGSAKPNPNIFAQACEVLRMPAEQVLHVGDDRRADFEGAREAGLHSRWLVRGKDVDQLSEGAIPSLLNVAELAVS